MTPARKRALRKYAASPKGKAAARASGARMRAKPGAAGIGMLRDSARLATNAAAYIAAA